jgi:hypothetical protein
VLEPELDPLLVVAVSFDVLFPFPLLEVEPLLFFERRLPLRFDDLLLLRELLPLLPEIAESLPLVLFVELLVALPLVLFVELLVALPLVLFVEASIALPLVLFVEASIALPLVVLVEALVLFVDFSAERTDPDSPFLRAF